MFARIALFSPPYSTLTYALPDMFPVNFWKKGLRVAMPLGKSNRALRAGCILDIMEQSGLGQGIDCKSIHFPLETEPLLSDDILDLALNLAFRHGIEPGAVLGRVLPQGLRSTTPKIKWFEAHKTLSIYEAGHLQGMEAQALARALILGKAMYSLAGQDEAALEMLILNANQPWPVRPAATKQIEILDFLNGTGQISRRTLLNKFGPSAAQALKTLLNRGLVATSRAYEEEVPQNLFPPSPQAFTLNAAQMEALAALKGALEDPAPQSRLLYGVTGSGKTAVYLELAKHCLESGKSIVLLAPEVALACKLYRDARQILPQDSILLYHGYQTPARREGIFREMAAKREARLVIGTRSALFLPIFQLACLILDEEHDASFKQDERIAYHAKEVAWYRAQQNNGLLALGSATPDIRTFYASQTGVLPRLCLPKRIGGAILPPVELVNIAPQPGLAGAIGLDAGGGTANLLAPATERALRQCLEKGEQAVILLNRRGYAPFIYCIRCNKTLRCPHCEIGLTFHKSARRLVCHYCNYSVPFPGPCPTCGSMNYIALGEGTEKLAERLEIIACQPILRLDRDNARKQGNIENILESFARGQSPFLVGTQMLSKGHHFPNVTLVVVADGDIGLNLPDYRAAERSFQLLTQSAGRAGRGGKPGRALIQTRNSNHYFWKYLLNYDYEGFYEDELARRRKMLYPPFTRLALLRLSFETGYAEGQRVISELGNFLREKARSMQIRLLGPAPAPLAMLRGQKRFHCLLKCDQWPQARQIWHLAQNFKPAAKLRMFLDLDPMNML